MFQKLLLPLFVACLILMGTRYFIQPFTICTESMSPTLNRGERTLIERIYRYQQDQKIDRFDLLAVIPPYVNGKYYQADSNLQTKIANLFGLPGLKQDPLYIRRVIALPGETVEIRKDVGTFVDGKLLEENAFTTDKPERDIRSLKDLYPTSQTDGASPSEAGPYGESEEPIVVPAKHFFVMPDHRNNYAGSDQWGFVSEAKVQGKISYKFGFFHLDEIKPPAVIFATEKVDLNDQGVKALEAQKFSQAIKLFNQSLAIDPEYTIARDNLSVAYNNYAIHLHIKPDAAIDKLHKALYIDPDNDLTRKNLNKMLSRMKLDPEDYKVRKELADQAFNEQRFLDALIEYREAARLKDEGVDEAVSAKIEQLEVQDLFPREYHHRNNAK